MVLDADKCLRMEAFVVSGPENNSPVKSVCFVFLTGTVLPQICVVYIVNPLVNLGQGTLRGLTFFRSVVLVSWQSVASR